MKKKEMIQSEIVDALLSAPKRSGLVLGATGIGKSKIGIDFIDKAYQVFSANKPGQVFSVLIVVPTEELRDNGWMNEFQKWNKDHIYLSCVQLVCYASLNKIYDNQYHIIILDEIHRLTPLNSKFFFMNNNKYFSIVGLTATYPRNLEKQEIIKRLGLKAVGKVTTDEAVEHGLIAPFEITVVTCDLNNHMKTIPINSKVNSFMITEFNHYQNMTRRIMQLDALDELRTPQQTKQLGFFRIQRFQFLSNCQTKANVANYVLNTLVPPTDKTIIFAGQKKQADMLCPHRYYAGISDAAYRKFCSGEINVLSCVNKLNEGINVPGGVDTAIITQVNSNDLTLIQRIGRILRLQPDKPDFVAKVYVIVALNTVDWDWWTKCSTGFDTSKIKVININELKNEQSNKS